MVKAMAPHARTSRPAVVPLSEDSLATLEAMAALAADSGNPINVVVPRAPGVVEHARRVAARAGVDACIDLMAATMRVRFSVS
jgi:hypothetical protein